ncbi:MAG TPA: GH1 family beta-glucosidase [Candidatus Saccharimonadaceae bacterium]|jgi:beta-glucosidase|nr:GH1 family beta-glucosidase [Candidatus Saccharimonadaceae bacterium]
MNGTDRFPEGFLWGAATSAYQIEGSPLADGAGPSIWHRFSHTPGRTRAGASADVACDHYRRWSEDVDLMRELGLQSYRFSLSWSRILPEGKGRVNPRGIDFYSRLVDKLLDAGIAPMATLYHWDLPAALDDLGGWLNPDVRHWFAEYADVVFRALADRVPMFATINEPWVVAHDGYWTGVNAPGHRNAFELPIVAHHTLCAHGAAVQAYRACGSGSAAKGTIGLVVNLEPKYPASVMPIDDQAVTRADAYFNRQYLDPVLLGRYPEDLIALYGEAWPNPDPADLELIHQPIDFVGVNYYTRKVVRHDDGVWPDRAHPVDVPGATYSETHWEFFPAGLTRTLCGIRERYGDVPLYVTENGVAIADPPPATDGVIVDALRVRYLRDHLNAVRAAMQQGVDVRGYYVWSLFDNLEWSAGYSKRFGIVHVDFDSLKRTPKASARVYSEWIAAHGLERART